MIGPRSLQAAGTLGGLATLGLAAVVLGGPWWVVAVIGASGAVSGRTGALVHAGATVALVGGAASAGAIWLVPVLVAGIVATVEAGAGRARATVVRPRVRARGPVLSVATAGVVAAAVVALATFGPDHAVPLALAAAAAMAGMLVALRPSPGPG